MRKGDKMTIESRKRISSAKIGKSYHTQEWKNKLSERMKGNKYTLGKKHSDDWKRKVSEKMKGKKFPPRTEEWKRLMSKKMKGKFRGGKSEGSLKYHAKVRDNYTCQICGLRDVEIMDVDHIKSKARNPQLRLELNNLMTICPNCHRRKTIRNKETNHYHILKS